MPTPYQVRALSVSLLVFGVSAIFGLTTYVQAKVTSSAFAGITPCSGTDRPLPQIPVDTTCEMTLWHLTLYDAPAMTYKLEASYGMSQPNTTGIAGGGTSITLENQWQITTGTADDPDAIVYELKIDTPDEAIYFVKLDDNLLHVLSPEKHMLVGNGGWSYTLNRSGDLMPAQMVDPTGELMPALPVEPPEEIAPLPESTSGVFDGRMPCHALVVAFTRVEPSPDCVKIKMRLTLHRDPLTNEPTTYDFNGVDVVRENPTGDEGTWSEVRGTPSDPNAVVYRLALDTPETFVDFLRPDDNHLLLLDEAGSLLVGDELWSYTLSRNAAKSEELLALSR